jgi:dTDP-4-amino-4,6-dideoxygalactose transaminase
MTSGEGGMITTNDDVLAEQCRVIRQHGMRRRNYHDELGFNFRVTDIHAAVGLEQLKKLEVKNTRRRKNASFLNHHLEGVITPVEPTGYEHVYHQYTIRIPGGQRDQLRTFLQENGIGSEVYYPVPVHKQSFYADKLGFHGTFPEAEHAAYEVLSLPVHPALSQADLETIIEKVNMFMSGRYQG